MIPSLGNFVVILQLYFSPEFSLQRAFYIITVLAATYPLFQLHLNQRREPHQPRVTAWLTSIFELLVDAFDSKHEHPYFLPDLTAGLGERLCRDLEQLYHLLGIDDPSAQLSLRRTSSSPLPDGTAFSVPTRDTHLRSDAVASRSRSACLMADFDGRRLTYSSRTARNTPLCRADYSDWSTMPAIFVFRSTAYGWIVGWLWLKKVPSCAFHSGWANFAEWLSDTINTGPRVTTRQSQRLYFEHFSRRLISSHGLEDTFTVPAHSSSHVLAESVRAAVGKDGGVRYHADLVAEGIVLEETTNGVADASAQEENLDNPDLMVQEIPAGLPTRPKQQARVHGSKRGYARMAVGDGKTITHKKCAVTVCRKPLVNYKNGRFCIDHLDMREKCGIIPCGRPIHSSGAVTCDDETHKSWHSKYLNRFSRQSFPGVQRVIRRQNEATGSQTGPALHAELPELGGVAGKDIVHTFRAGTTYCLQTFQWACGCPIGWGKCYTGEGSSQVLQIMDDIWEADPDSRPSFLAYDDACNLFRHIVTQNPNSPWIQSTKFIVDAWHYIGHSAADILCRLWCNPAPTNGSQPDLISVRVDDNGQTHTTRAFNTETAEQLNAWLNGYEAQLRQMTDINYDFCVHVLMLLYKESVESRVAKKDEGLTEEFWGKVNSTGQCTLGSSGNCPNIHRNPVEPTQCPMEFIVH
ncbi:hypothetical protein C8R43DRAFT_1053419 [Mycena crocata]|nr:hypothetical protein C8R43DRAFT_1053419 [Mycena crocata]